MDPAEQTELLLEVATLERQHEANKADQVQREADETVVRCEGRQLCIGEHDMLQRENTVSSVDRRIKVRTNLEVVDDALAIEEVICDGEEIPVQRLAPRVPAADVLPAVFPLQREQRGDFAVHQRLTQHHEDDHVHMAHEQESWRDETCEY